MTAMASAELHAGLFTDPLVDWPNDDLLISEASRDMLRLNYPALLRALDWPELREAFVRHNAPAGHNKRASHCQGLLAVAFAGLGLLLLGVAPALSHEGVVSKIALGCMSVGGCLGVLHWLVLRSRFSWLGHRFWTERLRQLYFQSLVNSMDLTVAAMTDDAGLAALRQQRAIWLAECYNHPADPRDRVRAIVRDRTEANTWLRHEWKHYQPPERPAAALEPLIEALYRQRICIQSIYAAKNLGSDVFSPPTRARLLHVVGDGATILVVVAAALGWKAYLYEPAVLGLSAVVWTSVAAVLSGTGLMARATDQGLQNEADADRYEWYADAVSEVKERYEAAPTERRVLELRCLEELAYRELRRFLRTHNAARFMM